VKTRFPVGNDWPSALMAMDEKGVSFCWKDYRAKGRTRLERWRAHQLK